ncbi:hypothetical protein BH11CYA1_BH11CYA1_48650 [soil metagenome]
MKVDSSYDTMLRDGAAWKADFLRFVSGRYIGEIRSKYGGMAAAEAHNSQLAPSSWVVPVMRAVTLELKFDEFGKFSSMDEWYVMH